MNVNVEVLNVNVVNDEINKLQNIDVNKLLQQSGLLVEARAKEYLVSRGRVKTGRLVNSIKTSEPQDNSIKVYTPVPYATYVEFGTGAYAMNGDGRPGYWVYVDEECNAPKSQVRNIYTYEEALKVYNMLAQKYGYAHVHVTNGQRPTRFFRDALEDSKEEIYQLFGEEYKGENK